MNATMERRETERRAKERREQKRQPFGPVLEFMVERLVLGSMATLIVYGGYRLFLL